MRKDTISLTVARGIGPLVSFLLIVILGRLYGPEEIGFFGIAMAVFAIMEAVTSLGMRHLLPREQARMHNGNIVVAASTVCFGMGIVLSLIITPFLIGLVRAEVATAIFLVLPALPVSGLMVVAEGYWLARLQVPRIVRALLVEQVVRTVASLAFLFGGFGVRGLLIAFILGRFTAYAFAIPTCGWNRPTIYTFRSLMSQVAPFVALELCFQAYWRVDVLLLGILSTARETGFYVIAYRLFSGLLLLPQSYGQILLPRLTAGRETKLFVKSLRDMLVVGVGLMIFMRLSGHWIVDLLYGGVYDKSATILVILAIGFIFACLDQPQGRFLIARGRQLWDLAALAGAVMANVIMNCIFIPRYGGVGAAWATVISLIFSVSIHGIAIRKSIARTNHET